MLDRLAVSMRASHVLAILLLAAALGLAGIGAALDDSFYLRLGTEALIFADSLCQLTFFSAIRARCRWGRRFILASAPMFRP